MAEKKLTTTAKKNNFRDEIMNEVADKLLNAGLGTVYDLEKEILIRGVEFDAVVRVVVKKDRMEIEFEEEEETEVKEEIEEKEE